MISTAMDAAQALTVLHNHVSQDLQFNLAVLREAARDGEAPAPGGYLVVCNDANQADPRFSIRNPEGAWRTPGGGWVRPGPAATEGIRHA
jgi:glycine/D-amino acid oxidase-like deaminating enzyme